jgi:hypothetical protein
MLRHLRTITLAYTEMSSLDDILAGMDAWSNAQVYKKPVTKVVTAVAKPAPSLSSNSPQKKVLKKRKIDQHFEKIQVVPESEKRKKAIDVINNLMKPQGNPPFLSSVHPYSYFLSSYNIFIPFSTTICVTSWRCASNSDNSTL